MAEGSEQTAGAKKETAPTPEAKKEAVLPQKSEEALKAAQNQDAEKFQNSVTLHSTPEFIELMRETARRKLELTRDVRRIVRARLEADMKDEKKTPEEKQKLQEVVVPIASKSMVGEVGESALEMAKPVGGFLASGMEKAKEWSMKAAERIEKMPGGETAKRWAKNTIHFFGDVIDDTKYMFGTTVPERAKSIGHFLGSWAEKIFYHVLATPSLLGIDEHMPFLGKISMNAKEQLMRISAEEAIESAIRDEKEAKPAEVVFDKKNAKMEWKQHRLRQASQPTPANGQNPSPADINWYVETRNWIAKQRELGFGTKDKKIMVTLDAISNRSASQLSAETQVAKERGEKLKEAWSLPNATVKFEGDKVKARKETTGAWSLTFPKMDALAQDGKPVSAEAKLLQEAMTKMPDVGEIEIGGTGWQIRRAEGVAGIVISPSIDHSLFAPLDAAAKAFNSQSRASVLRIDSSGALKDKTINFALENSVTVLKCDPQTGLEMVGKFLDQRLLQDADTGTTWAWSGDKWSALPAKQS